MKEWDRFKEFHKDLSAEELLLKRQEFVDMRMGERTIYTSSERDSPARTYNLLIADYVKNNERFREAVTQNGVLNEKILNNAVTDVKKMFVALADIAEGDISPKGILDAFDSILAYNPSNIDHNANVTVDINFGQMEESIKQWSTTFRGILLNAELADPNLGKLINEDVIIRFMQAQEGGLPVLTTLDRESLAALVNRFEMWLSGPEGRDAFHTEVWMHLTDNAKNDFLEAIGSTITAADSKKEINAELVDYFTCAFKAMIKNIKDADEDELDIALNMITKDFD